MEIWGLIPARGGSKRIPGKNLKDIGGVSLLRLAVEKMLRAGFTEVWVSTEDDQIATEARNAGAKVHCRPTWLAFDYSTTLDVVRDFFRARRCDAVVLHQCTSPLVTVQTLVTVADKMAGPCGGDYVVTVTAEAMALEPFRAPWDDRTHQLVMRETGAAYGICRGGLRDPHPQPVLVIESPAHALDIDEPWQLQRARDVWPTMAPLVWAQPVHNLA